MLPLQTAPWSLQNGEPFVSLLSVQVALMCSGGDFANITPMGREAKTRENQGKYLSFSFKIRQWLLHKDSKLQFYPTQAKSQTEIMLKLWHKFANQSKTFVIKWCGNYGAATCRQKVRMSFLKPNKGHSHNEIHGNMVARLSNQPFFPKPLFRVLLLKKEITKFEKLGIEE